MTHCGYGPCITLPPPPPNSTRIPTLIATNRGALSRNPVPIILRPLPPLTQNNPYNNKPHRTLSRNPFPILEAPYKCVRRLRF